MIRKRLWQGCVRERLCYRPAKLTTEAIPTLVENELDGDNSILTLGDLKIYLRVVAFPCRELGPILRRIIC